MHNKKSAHKTPIQKGMFKALLKYVFKTNKIRYPLAIILNLFSSLTMILHRCLLELL
ncbi:ABC transporter ATP-binding protein [Mycoplasmopsis anatis]|uniref:hypothetical protein n=1 Tax=Mycoplasmopsis anatis TaxID=171279 RepID=UPI003F8550FE